jgi:hypothetical protein
MENPLESVVPVRILVGDKKSESLFLSRRQFRRLVSQILNDSGEYVGDGIRIDAQGRFEVSDLTFDPFGIHIYSPLLGLNLHFWHARQRRRAAGLDVGAFPAYRAQASLWSNAPS